MSCLDGITDSLDTGLSKPRETGKDREAWCAAGHGVTEQHQGGIPALYLADYH